MQFFVPHCTFTFLEHFTHASSPSSSSTVLLLLFITSSSFTQDFTLSNPQFPSNQSPDPKLRLPKQTSKQKSRYKPIYRLYG